MDEFFERGSDVPNIEPGVYTATVAAINPGPDPSKTPYGNPTLEWEFSVTGGMLEDETLTVGCLTGTRIGGEKSKLRQFIEALLGEVPDKVGPADLVGKPCRVFVEVKESGWPQVTKVLPRSSRGK